MERQQLWKVPRTHYNVKLKAQILLGMICESIGRCQGKEGKSWSWHRYLFPHIKYSWQNLEIEWENMIDFQCLKIASESWLQTLIIDKIMKCHYKTCMSDQKKFADYTERLPAVSKMPKFFKLCSNTKLRSNWGQSFFSLAMTEIPQCVMRAKEDYFKTEGPSFTLFRVESLTQKVVSTWQSCHEKVDDDDDVMPRFSNRKSDGCKSLSFLPCQKWKLAFYPVSYLNVYDIINGPIKSFTRKSVFPYSGSSPSLYFWEQG